MGSRNRLQVVLGQALLVVVVIARVRAAGIVGRSVVQQRLCIGPVLRVMGNVGNMLLVDASGVLGVILLVVAGGEGVVKRRVMGCRHSLHVVCVQAFLMGVV